MPDNSDMRLLLPLHQRIESQEREIALLKAQNTALQEEAATWLERYMVERDAGEQGRERVRELLRDRSALLNLISRVRELVKE